MLTKTKKRKGPDYEDEISLNIDDETKNLFYDGNGTKMSKKNKELYEKYKECKKIIKSREISLIDILDSPIKNNSKIADLIEQYENMKTLYPNSTDFLNERDTLRHNFFKLIEEYTSSPTFSPLNLTKLSVSQPVSPSNFILHDKNLFNPFNPLSFEININNSSVSEETQFRRKLNLCIISEENKKAIENKIQEFSNNHKGEEQNKIKRWINTALSLPHDKVSPKLSEEEIQQKIKYTKDYLDEKLYGMQRTKEKIILFLNKKLREDNCKGVNIALLGEAGIGKTTLIKALSHCLNFPYSQISSGTCSDSEFLTGHGFTYLGSKEGEISRCMIRNGVKNGIVFFDEFEKMARKKEVIATLLHVTDFTQNNQYRDSYLSEITQDLSKTWFFFSMNSLPEDNAMRDRLEVIHVENYSFNDKKEIVKNYIIPKFMKEFKIDPEILKFPQRVIGILISDEKSSIRDIERKVGNILEKIYFFLTNKDIGDKYNFTWFDMIRKNMDLNDGKIILTDSLVDLFLKKTTIIDNISMQMMYL